MRRYATDRDTWPAIDAIDRAISSAEAGDAPCLATAIYLSLLMDGWNIKQKEDA